MTTSRRQFLRFFLQGAGCFTALAATPFSPRVRPATADATRIGFPHGVFSSIVYRSTGSLWLARLAGRRATNPHLTWVDSNAVGYGIVTAGPETCAVELVGIEAPLEDLAGAPSPVVRRVRFRLRPGEKVPVPVELEGAPPFPVESI